MTKQCVGCYEELGPDAIRVEGLGSVCPTCYEVVDIVFEVEIERVQEARRQVQAVIDKLESGTW